MGEMKNKTNQYTQVLEGGNEYLIASLYNLLTDAYVGLAGHECEEGAKERDGHINSALLYVERAKEGMTHLNHSSSLPPNLTCQESASLTPFSPC